MHGDIAVSLRTLTTFLLVLARISGVFVYLPLPGRDAGPSLPRVVLAVATAIAVTPYWPSEGTPEASPSLIVLWLGSELALGLTIGLTVSFLAEALSVGAQILSLQAGYAYASVIDPATQADSDVLQVLAQLLSGLLFFGLHLDGMAIKTFVYSLRSYPPGQFVLTAGLAKTVLGLSSNILVVALQLAFPVIAVLLAVEISLAIVGRFSTQLHLGSEAVSIKMLITLLILVSILRIIPTLYQNFASQLFEFLRTQFWSVAAH